MAEELSTNKTESIPDWLEKLQNESWQAEILISGGAFIGLAAIFDSLGGLGDVLVYSSSINGFIIVILLLAIVFGCSFLASGFLIHLILRGYWIGLIGLNYVFPGGINKEKLAFKGKFSTIIKDPSNIPLILRIDKICGGIFAFTFISFFSLIGLVLFIGVLAIMIYFLGLLDSNRLKSIVIIAFVLIGVISFIDYLTFGWLKRIRWFSRVYYPIHHFVSLITLSVAYRRLYYTLTSNVKWRYLFLFLALAQVLIGTAIVSFGDRDSSFVKSIVSRNSGTAGLGTSEFLTIKNEVVTGRMLEISLIHVIRLEQSMFELWQRNNRGNQTISSFGELKAEDQLKLVDSIYQIRIDGNLCTTLKWSLRRVTSSTNFFAPDRFILKTYADVSKLINGEHVLTVKLKSVNLLLPTLQDEGSGSNAKAYFYIDRDGMTSND